MNDDAPRKTYWWVRHHRDDVVEIALRIGTRWYALERGESYSTASEIGRYYELLEIAPIPIFREELRYTPLLLPKYVAASKSVLGTCPPPAS